MGAKALKAIATATLLSVLPLFASSQRSKGDWKVLPSNGLSVYWTRTKEGFVAKFLKRGNERRLLMLETTSPNIAKAKSVSLRFRLRFTFVPASGLETRLALLAFGSRGEVWFKVSNPMKLTGEVEWQMPLTGLQPAAFNSVKAELDLTRIRRLQVGLAIDGACAGVWEVLHIALNTEPFRPTRPFIVPFPPETQLSLTHDPAAEAKTGIVKEGEKLFWRTEFTIPGGRHMYVLPALTIPDADLTGYSALQLTYRARLPVGVKALLITLVERDGSHYYTDWIAAPAEKWRTLTIPLSEFRLGGWSQDENGKLDLDQIGSIIVGMHGTTSEQKGSGTIWVASISFVP
ncbi:MAG: hypothetical protein N3B10_10935 [Armatimonadetes bacterium]|nr:hypothetical protein [Armatimonadota bacterium]